VSENERQGSRAALVETLRVRQNARRGLAIGVVFAALVFVVFVVFPSETSRATVYYGALAFVLAMTVAGLATVLFVAVRAYRLTREL